MTVISVLGFQLKFELACNEKEEYLIVNADYQRQMELAKELIKRNHPDIVLFPEMCYQKSDQDYFKEASKDCLIVARSHYENGKNQSILFQNGIPSHIQKQNASGAEPMIRLHRNPTPQVFITNYLEDHIVSVKGKKFVLCNCLEYYQNAYAIALQREDLFGFLCFCSNRNSQLFKEETKVIHNHYERLYSFVVNGITTYNGLPYAKGESYVYGPIQGHEKEWLSQEGISMDDHHSSILNLGSEPSYFYGEFADQFSSFGRSNAYLNNPCKVKVKQMKWGE